MFKINNNLGNMIKIFRKKANLTQPELASLLRVSFSTLRRWEAYGGQPRADELKRICEVLNCTETELINGPVSNDWELRIKISKERVIEVGNIGSSAEINVGDTAMAITLSANYDLWEDDAKFEGLVEQLRTKRKAALKLRKESW